MFNGSAKGKGRNSIKKKYLISTLDISPKIIIVKTESNTLVTASILVKVNLDKKLGLLEFLINILLIFWNILFIILLNLIFLAILSKWMIGSWV